MNVKHVICQWGGPYFSCGCPYLENVAGSLDCSDRGRGPYLESVARNLDCTDLGRVPYSENVARSLDCTVRARGQYCKNVARSLDYEVRTMEFRSTLQPFKKLDF